jgi:cytochrome c-type biogenesis protein CcmH
MTLYFLIFSSLLLCVSALFVLVLPQRWQRSHTVEGNTDWLRLRQRELADSAAELREEAALRVIEEGPDRPQDATKPHYVLRYQLAGVLAVLVLVAGLYSKLGGLEDLSIADALEGLDGASPAEISALIERIQRRALQRPDNADYSLLLAEYHFSANEPSQALVYFDRLIEAGSTSPDILSKAAQAEFLSADRQLSARARSRAERALALDPMAPAALATLGMAAFESADFVAAVQYWEALRSLEPEGSPGYQMLTQVIERARNEMVDSGLTTEMPPGLRIQVVLDDALNVDVAATVYVFARPDQQQGGMPIAVVRQVVTEWPLVLTLDDGNSMAGQKLSSFDRVSVEVQISANGQPGRENSLAWNVVSSASVGSPEPINVILGRVDTL